jgi:outer membrane protein
VRAAYFAARAQRDLVGVAQETVRNDEAHLRQVQGFVDVGTQPAIALAQTRSQLASARLQLIQADNAYAIARSQLLQAMGEQGSLDFDVADDALPPVTGEEGPLDPLVEEAIAARPELASLLEQRRAEQLTRSAARGGYLPSVSARAVGSEFGSHPLDPTNGNVQNWSAGVNLSWSLFDGGLTHARVQEADANLQSIQAQEDALRLSIRVAVEQASLGVRAAAASVSAADDALTNAREQLRLAEGRFQAGAGSIIELGDAQVAASTAAATRVQAEYNLAAARAALLRALARR